MQALASINEDTSTEFTQDTVIQGSIGKNAKITVINGDLHILGSVAEGVTIAVSRTLARVADDGTCLGTAIIKIDGNVANHVNIKCDGSITIKGKVGSHSIIATSNGDVQLTDVASDSKILNNVGNIGINAIGVNTHVETVSGDIYCNYIAENAQIEVTNGNIQFRAAHRNASLSVLAGNVKRERSNSLFAPNSSNQAVSTLEKTTAEKTNTSAVKQKKCCFIM